LIDKVKHLQGELLDIEILLQNALEKSRLEFFKKIKEMLDSMREKTANYMGTEIHDEINEFIEKFREEVLKERDQYETHVNLMNDEEVENFTNQD